MLKTLIAASAGLVGSAHAFWRMECPSRIGLARMDPIMDPGETSEHVHAIHGSSGFAETADTQSLRSGDCTSCRVTQDKSAYWTPALYFKDADTGKFELVDQVGGMLAYYNLNGKNIKAYPKDFRMIAGDNSRRTFTAGDPSYADPAKSNWAALGQTTQKDLEQRALGFNCLNYAKSAEGTLYRHFMPDKDFLDANCKDGLRLEIMFPSCWDGKRADSANHKDHVAYPDLVMTGTCPDSHPVQLPGLMFETIWATDNYEGRNGMFVIANGDPTGFGYHGDFIMGWDHDFLQKAVNTCTNLSGRIEDCPLFNIVDEATTSQCQMDVPHALRAEKLLSNLNVLPGDVPITYEGGSTGGGEDQPSKPSASYSPGATPSDPASPLPGQVFKESSVYAPPVPTTSSSSSKPVNDVKIAAAPSTTSTPTPTSQSTPSTTPTPSTPPADPNVSYESTQYITNGNVVSKILWAEEVVWVTEMVDTTTTITRKGDPAPASSTAEAEAASPADSKHMRRAAHVHGHGHRHL